MTCTRIRLSRRWKITMNWPIFRSTSKVLMKTSTYVRTWPALSYHKILLLVWRSSAVNMARMLSMRKNQVAGVLVSCRWILFRSRLPRFLLFLIQASSSKRKGIRCLANLIGLLYIKRTLTWIWSSKHRTIKMFTQTTTSYLARIKWQNKFSCKSSTRTACQDSRRNQPNLE